MKKLIMAVILILAALVIAQENYPSEHVNKPLVYDPAKITVEGDKAKISGTVEYTKAELEAKQEALDKENTGKLAQIKRLDNLIAKLQADRAALLQAIAINEAVKAKVAEIADKIK